MLQSKMKDVPEEMQEKLFTAIEKNPAEEIQGKMKGGRDQMSAVMEVIGSHQEELQALMKDDS